MGTERRGKDTLASKPRLICLEGSAGTGKTTICDALGLRLRVTGLRVAQVSEFSATAAGDELRNGLARFAADRPPWSPIETLQRCTEDKFRSLSSVDYRDRAFVILDRGFITQLVLGMPLIRCHADRVFAAATIRQFNAWLADTFEVSTIVLNTPLAENIFRLEQRLGRLMCSHEQATLRLERLRYLSLTRKPGTERLNLRVVPAAGPPEDITTEIIGIRCESA